MAAEVGAAGRHIISRGGEGIQLGSGRAGGGRGAIGGGWAINHHSFLGVSIVTDVIVVFTVYRFTC